MYKLLSAVAVAGLIAAGMATPGNAAPRERNGIEHRSVKPDEFSAHRRKARRHSRRAYRRVVRPRYYSYRPAYAYRPYTYYRPYYRPYYSYAPAPVIPFGLGFGFGHFGGHHW